MHAGFAIFVSHSPSSPWEHASQQPEPSQTAVLVLVYLTLCHTTEMRGACMLIKAIGTL